MNYVIAKIKKINSHIKTYVNENPNIGTYIGVYIDLFLSILRNGVNLDEYFQYQFYFKRNRERKKYIVHRKRMRIVKALNDPAKKEIFDSKILFNKTFSDYIKRDWLDFAVCEKKDFLEFASKHNKAFVKPKQSFYGLGVGVYSLEGDLDSLYNKFKSEDVLMESLIEEEKEMSEFNPSSVNTLRVVTVVKNSEPKVMTGTFRMGNGNKCADNFHHDGLAALIDVETGIVCTKAVDRYLKQYVVHPISGKQIVGYKIKHWEKIMETAKRAAMVVPEVGYVGWDIVVDKDGEVVIIEGNQCADPDVTQIPDQTGKWSMYKNFIKK